MTADIDDISLRDLTEEDLGLLLKWLTDERVLEHYDGRDTRYDADSIREKYMEPLPPDSFRKIAEYRGMPLGYIQIFFADDKIREEYSYTGPGKTYAADMFIGLPEYWNKGIGSAMIGQLCRWLSENRGADAVILDPRTENTRSVHVYEKCGFRKICLLPAHEMHEGQLCDCFLMECRLDCPQSEVTE